MGSWGFTVKEERQRSEFVRPNRQGTVQEDFFMPIGNPPLLPRPKGHSSQSGLTLLHVVQRFPI